MNLHWIPQLSNKHSIVHAKCVLRAPLAISIGATLSSEICSPPYSVAPENAQFAADNGCSLTSHVQYEVGSRNSPVFPLQHHNTTTIPAKPRILLVPRNSDDSRIVAGLRISQRIPSRRLVGSSELPMQQWLSVFLGSTSQYSLCTVGGLPRDAVGETF